jgi:predicted RNA polymerase sigma factor
MFMVSLRRGSGGALHAILPDHPETAGLLALMLLTDARRPARTGPDGQLIPLADQDRSRWDQELISEGVALISAASCHRHFARFTGVIVIAVGVSGRR